MSLYEPGWTSVKNCTVKASNFITYSTNYIQIGRGTGSAGSARGLALECNVSKYKKLYFEGYRTTISDNAYGLCGYSTTYSALNHFAVSQEIRATSATIYEFDISSLSGSIFIQICQGMSYSYITKIWLE